MLTYHVVPGKLVGRRRSWPTSRRWAARRPYKTVAGGKLTFSMKDGALWVWDESGDSAKVTIADVNQSNGVIHVIDTVLLPKM